MQPCLLYPLHSNVRRAGVPRNLAADCCIYLYRVYHSNHCQKIRSSATTRFGFARIRLHWKSVSASHSCLLCMYIQRTPGNRASPRRKKQLLLRYSRSLRSQSHTTDELFCPEALLVSSRYGFLPMCSSTLSIVVSPPRYQS